MFGTYVHTFWEIDDVPTGSLQRNRGAEFSIPCLEEKMYVVEVGRWLFSLRLSGNGDGDFGFYFGLQLSVIWADAPSLLGLT